jgi:hypothetical protein
MLITTAWLSCLPSLTFAAALGVRAGANYWSYDISGTARFETSDNSNDIVVNNDLGYWVLTCKQLPGCFDTR